MTDLATKSGADETHSDDSADLVEEVDDDLTEEPDDAEGGPSDEAADDADELDDSVEEPVADESDDVEVPADAEEPADVDEIAAEDLETDAAPAESEDVTVDEPDVEPEPETPEDATLTEPVTAPEVEDDLAPAPETPDDTLVLAAVAAPVAETVVQPAPTIGEAPAAYAWAPAEPKSKKRRLALWIGIPIAVVAVGAIATSLVVIAPGTSVAGVAVGGLTPGAAADVIADRLARTTIVLTGEGGDTDITGAELGASIDARALADEAFAAHPAWNPTAWFASPTDVPVTLDTAVAVAALREAVPSMYVDPTNAEIGFDAATASYVVTPGIDGAGVDVAAVEAALNEAFAEGQTVIELPATTAPVAPEGPTFVAAATVGILNRMLDSAGFYVGAERTVPVDRATVASWLTVAPADRGTFEVTADASAIQPFVEGLPAAVNIAPVASTTIVNSAGRVLSTPTEGVVGRTLDTTDGIAAAYADQLASGNGAYALPVSEVGFNTTTLARLLEVDLSEQRLYVKENGNVVDSWLISSGKTNHATTPGRYTINYKTTVQTMNGFDRDAAGNITGTYSTPNVKWPMYFNGGQAFHGVYWHNNYGNRMSHGCVGMPEYRAQWLYNWSPYGTDVWIHE